MFVEKSKRKCPTKIPEHWNKTTLGEVIQEIKNGFASGRRDKGGIVQIRMNNVTSDGHLIFDSLVKVPVPKYVDSWLLKKGDFLFNNTNSVALVGKSAVFNEAPFPCTFSNHFTRIRFKLEFVLPEIVLYHFIMLWEQGYFKSVAIRHVGQSAVHNHHLLDIQISLPPLFEQQKIVEIISTVDQAIQKVGQAIEKTERLKKGLMQELLTKGIGHKEFKKTDSGVIPKTWELKKLEEISVEFVSGGTPSTSKDEYWNGDIPWMTSAFITEREVKTGQRFITNEGLKKSATKIVPKNNLLVATRVGIGKAAVNRIDIAISQDLTGIILDNNKAIPDFIYWHIVNSGKRLKSMAQGSTIKGILREDLQKISIPLPPLPEQQKIAEILSSVDKRIETLKKRKERLEKVKRGLMEDLLTGKKRVKLED